MILVHFSVFIFCSLILFPWIHFEIRCFFIVVKADVFDTHKHVFLLHLVFYNELISFLYTALMSLYDGVMFWYHITVHWLTVYVWLNRSTTGNKVCFVFPACHSRTCWQMSPPWDGVPYNPKQWMMCRNYNLIDCCSFLYNITFDRIQ